MYILKHESESEKKNILKHENTPHQIGCCAPKDQYTSLCQELYTLHIAPAPIFYSPFVEF